MDYDSEESFWDRKEPVKTMLICVMVFAVGMWLLPIVGSVLCGK